MSKVEVEKEEEEEGEEFVVEEGDVSEEGDEEEGDVEVELHGIGITTREENDDEETDTVVTIQEGKREEVKEKDEDEEWIDNVLFRESDDIFSGLTPSKLKGEEDLEKKYSNFFDSDTVKLSSIQIGQLADHGDDEGEGEVKSELLRGFRDQSELTTEGMKALYNIRKFEREEKESHAKLAVRKVRNKQLKKFNRNEKLRRGKYKEMSEIARHKFRALEDKMKMEIGKQKGRLEANNVEMDVRKKVWRLQYGKSPNLLDVRLCQLRTIGNKLPEGEYIMKIAVYDRLGGSPLKYQKHAADHFKKGGTTVFHSGTFSDVNMVFNQCIRMTVPSLNDLTYRQAIVFQLVHYRVGIGDTFQILDTPVAWGAFPLVDNNFKFIMGCFKTPLIVGDMNETIDKFITIENAIRKSLNIWLGNLYFEVKLAGGDEDIIVPREFFLEVVHENKEDKILKRFENIDVNELKIIKGEDGEVLFDGNIAEGLEALGAEEAKEEEEGESGSDREEVIQIVERIVHSDDEDGAVRFEEEEEEEEDDSFRTPEKEQRVEDEEEKKEKKEDKGRTQEILLENPRVWFGNPRFGFVEEKDRIIGTEQKKDVTKIIDEDLNVLSPDEYNKQIEDEKEVDDPTFLSPFSGKAKKLRDLKKIEKMQHDHDILSQSFAVRRKKMLEARKLENFPREYVDDFSYQKKRFYSNREKTHRETGERDVERVENSFFSEIFYNLGKAKVDLSLYKQSVKRKKFSWQKTPVFIEKLKFLTKSTIIDLGLSNFRKWEFYFMIILVCLVLYVRCFPHYLGQWLFLELYKVPFSNPYLYPWYIRFSYKTRFQSSIFNFGYVVSGFVFNIGLSVFLIVFVAIAQKMFKTIPVLLYRIFLLFQIAVLFDPPLFLGFDFLSSFFTPEETPYGEFFVLSDYYEKTEGSGLPGILLTVLLYVPLFAIQILLIYQYLVRIHMNCRTFDVYSRLNKPERKFYLPNDLSVSREQFDRIINVSKNWRGASGNTRKVVTDVVQKDAKEIKILKRIGYLLQTIMYPYDYLKFIAKNENPFYDQFATIPVPEALKTNKNASISFLRKISIGKQFEIKNFNGLVNDLLFDEVDERSFFKKKQYVIHLFKKFEVVHPVQLKRLVDRKQKGVRVIGCLLHDNIYYSDVSFISEKVLELEIPTKEEVNKSKMSSLEHFYKNKIKIPYEQRFVYGKKIHPLPQEEEKISELEIEEEEEEKIPQSSVKKDEDVSKQSLVGEKRKIDQKGDEGSSCLRIQIFIRTIKGRLINYRNFIQTPNGHLCEIFSSSKNQLSKSTICDPNSIDFWVSKVYEKIQEEDRRELRDKRSQKRRIRRAYYSKKLMGKYKLLKKKKQLEKGRKVVDTM